MPELEIQPFSEEHVEAAGELLAERHARHLAAEPHLPENIDFKAEIEALRSSEGASGVVALSGGEIVGYLLGVRRDDAIWGPNVWIELAGHAVKEPEVVRDLYGVAAADWVDEGRHRHYAVVPATDQNLVEAWFRLSFGAQHATGIQELPVSARDPASVNVRPAAVRDADAALDLDWALPQHQAQSPVFAPQPTWTDEELRAEFLVDIEDPEIGMFVAEIDGSVVGLLTMVSVEKSNLHSGLSRPKNTALLGYAAVRPTPVAPVPGSR